MTRLEPEEVLDFVDSALKVRIPEPNETFKIGDNEFLRPKDMDAPLIDVKLAPLVSRFDVKSLILLLSALMCEKRIIFIGDDLSTLSECIHAAVAILFPFNIDVSLTVAPSPGITSSSPSFLPRCSPM